MKRALILTLISFSLTSAILAEEVETCRQLLVSDWELCHSCDEENAKFFADADKGYRDCAGPLLPMDLRIKALLKYARAAFIRDELHENLVALREAQAIVDREQGGSTDERIAVLDEVAQGELLASLGPDAITHASRALSLRQAKFGEDSPESIHGMVVLGSIHAAFSEFETSESLMQKAIETARRICRPECEALVEAYTGMMIVCEMQGKKNEAKIYDELAMEATPSRPRSSTRRRQ